MYAWSTIFRISVIFFALVVSSCSPVIPSALPTQSPPSNTVTPIPGVLSGNYSAPDFQLNTLDGKTVKLSDYRGKPVLLNFWATWCGPCRYEIPFLDQINAAYSQKGLVMLAVDLGEDAATVSNFLATENVSLRVLLDTDKSVAQKYTIVGIPTTFLVDTEGILRYKKVGAFQDKTEIENALSLVIP
jgi:cytochrome c biogenesis protein CcmG/thiol:disulfide interchange protein DsbE